MSSVKRVSGDYTIQTINAGDLVTLQSTNVNIVGNLTVTGNAVLTGNINADKIFNGTTSIDIPVVNGNANITIGAVSNVAVFATTGQFITGLQSVTGNIDGGNLRTAGQVSATANITGGNLIVSSGNINITRASTATTQPAIRFTDSNTAVTTLGSNIGSVEWFTNDSTGAAARVTARIQAVYEDTNGNANIQIQTGSTSTPTTRITVIGSSGNVGIANAAPLDALAVTGSIYGSSTFFAVGNITGANLRTGGLVTATGNVTGGNLITAGLITATGNITGGNIISLGAVSAGAAGITATGNVRGGNVNSDGSSSSTGNVTGANIVAAQNIYTTGNVLANVVSATANIVSSNISISGNMSGAGIGVENIVWQPTTVAFNSAVQANVGSLGFLALAGRSYKYEAFMPILPAGATSTGFSTYFDAGTCYYTVEFQTTQTSAFNTSTSNVSGTAPATAGMTGTTPRTARITGTIYSAGNANVAIQAQTSAANIDIQSGAYLTYTRIS
jgi:filamentous hemagglutinin